MSTKVSKEEAEALLRKYRQGQCTPAEIEIINRWYRSYGDKDLDAEVLMDSEKQALLKDEMLRKIRESIRLSEEEVNYPDRDEVSSNTLRFIGSRTLLKIAAVLVVTLVTGLYFYSVTTVQKGSDAVEFISDSQEEAVDRLVKSSSPVVYLSDGSVVWLKGQSYLEYPEKFAGGNREVTLRGEAFFDVAADTQKPFIIHSANFTTQVLGTSFNIRDYGDDEADEVVVVHGKVMVSVKEPTADHLREVILRPNKKAIYFPKENILRQSDAVDVPVEILNKRKMDFEEVKLGDIIKVLNAEYNLNISVSNKGMNGCIITANLTGVSVEVGLQVLAKTMNATYHVNKEGGIVIDGTGCEN